MAMQLATAGLAALAATVLLPRAQATVTSTSTFERCTNDEDNCETKLTMQINLQSGENGGEEVLISQVGCADGLCNGADSGTLNNTVKLTFYHTRPVLSYDLFYFADFNAKPREVVVYGGTGPDGEQCSGPAGMSLSNLPSGVSVDTDQCYGKWLGPTCRDGGRDPDVSCGWLYPQSYIAELQRQPNPVINNIAELLTVPWQSAPLDRRRDRVANVVPDSQGFCCDCDTQHFLFENVDISRGNIQCNALDSDSPHASAHCLRMDKLWYSAYDIGQSRENYNIFVNIQTCDQAGSNCVRPAGMRITSVGPERPRTVLRNAGNDIRIEWAPFGSADNALDLSSKMLLRPNCHGNADCLDDYAALSSFYDQIPGGVDINEPSRWLLIPRSDISMTGGDCNQIGVSYSGFRNQGENKCIRPFDSCLDRIEINGRLMSSSRITDYFEEDMESVMSNRVGRFFPQFVYPGSTLAVEKNGDDFAQLSYEVDEYRVSQITLIMSGELVSVMEYTGELDMVDFGLSCMSDRMTPVDCFHNVGGTFEAASNDGLLAVTLRNRGEHPDMYTISFPSEKFEIDRGEGSTEGDAGGRYTNMMQSGNMNLSPIQAKSTDMLQGRAGCANPPCTKRCNAGYLFQQGVSAQATACWDMAEESARSGGRRRVQGAVDPSDNARGSSFDPYVQCGGGDDPSGLLYPELRDDCDTVAFQVHSNNGLDISYCVHVEVTNNIGELEYPQQYKKPGAVYSEASRSYVGGTEGGQLIATTPDEQNEQGRVCFNTTQIDYVLVGDAEDAFAADGEPLRVLGNSLSCGQLCPSTFDVMCAASQPACSDSFFTAALIVAAIILGAVACRKLGIGPCGTKRRVQAVHRPPPRSDKSASRDYESGGFQATDSTANPVSRGQVQEPDLEAKYGKE